MTNITLKASLIGAVFALQACATNGELNRNGSQSISNTTTSMAQSRQMIKLGKKTDNPLALVAEDFLQALSQVQGYSAAVTTISVAPSTNGFHKAMASGLQRRGYTLINGSRGMHRLRTTASVNKNNTYEITFTFQLDTLAMKRTYIVGKNYVRPASSLYVRGVSPDSIRLDDRVFVDNMGA